MPAATKVFSRYLCLCLLLLLTACGGDPLEKRGSFATQTEIITITNPEDASRPIHATIYAPAKLPSKTLAQGPFGLVILAPGFGATYNFYETYSRHIASHGYIVVGMNFRRPLISLDGQHDYLARQMGYVIEHVRTANEFVADRIDMDKLAVGGHSLGGKIAFYYASLNPEVSAVLALDPSNSGGPPCQISTKYCNGYAVAPNSVTGDLGRLNLVTAPSLIFRAEPDLTNPDDHNNAWWFFYGSDGAGLNGTNGPSVFFNMGQVGHTAWIQPLGYHTPRITKRTLVAWLKVYLDGRSEFLNYFGDEKNGEDLELGRIVSIEDKEVFN